MVLTLKCKCRIWVFARNSFGFQWILMIFCIFMHSAMFFLVCIFFSIFNHQQCFFIKVSNDLSWNDLFTWQFYPRTCLISTHFEFKVRIAQKMVISFIIWNHTKKHLIYMWKWSFGQKSSKTLPYRVNTTVCTSVVKKFYNYNTF